MRLLCKDVAIGSPRLSRVSTPNARPEEVREAGLAAIYQSFQELQDHTFPRFCTEPVQTFLASLIVPVEHSPSRTMPSHPLDILSLEETNCARDLVANFHPDTVISFREIYLEEPPKEALLQFLAAEHAGKEGVRPHRSALVQYDVIGTDRIPQSHESVIDLEDKKRTSHALVDKDQHAGLTLCVVRLRGFDPPG